MKHDSNIYNSFKLFSFEPVNLLVLINSEIRFPLYRHLQSNAQLATTRANNKGDPSILMTPENEPYWVAPFSK